MKRPNLREKPITVSGTYKLLMSKVHDKYDYEKYANDLDKYIDYLEEKINSHLKQ